MVLLRVAWVERERQIVGEGVDGCGRWANPQTKPGVLHRVKDLIFPCLFFVSKHSLFLDNLSSDYLFYVNLLFLRKRDEIIVIYKVVLFLSLVKQSRCPASVTTPIEID